MKKIILFVFVIAIVGIVVAVWQMQGPATGVIKQAAPQTSAASTEKPMEKIRFDGKYISFAYQDAYKPVVSDDHEPSKQSAFLESVFLSAYGATSSKKLAVAVSPLESGNFEDNSSFKFRISTPKLYTQSMIDVDGERVVLFTRDEDTREQTVFLKHGGMVASIAASSSSESLDKLKEELIVVIKSVRWK